MPPTEFENYVKCDLLIKIYHVQIENDIICGGLCLHVLYKLLIKKLTYFRIVFYLFTFKKCQLIHSDLEVIK